VRFAEKLAVDHQKVDDALWAEVRAQFSEAEVSELLADGLPAYLQRIQALVAEAALAVQKAYFLH